MSIGPIILGNCSTCCLTQESQTVTATVLFAFGWYVDTHGHYQALPSGLPGALPQNPVPGQIIPATIFRTFTEQTFDANGVLLQTVIASYNIYGKLTLTTTGVNPPTSGAPLPYQVVNNYTDPWTYYQAVAICTALLGAATLAVGGGGTGPYTLTAGGTVELCYPSQSSLFASSTNLINVGYDTSGNITYSDGYGPVGAESAFCFAANGEICLNQNGGGAVELITCVIVSVKTANRCPAALQSRDDFALSATGTNELPTLPIYSIFQDSVQLVPALGPGEFVFDPTDVNGNGSIGSSQWETAAAPATPATNTPAAGNPNLNVGAAGGAGGGSNNNL